MASGSPRIFFTTNPDRDEWKELQNNKLTISETDPAFFLDDDGRVYLYWGCSDKNPIMGVEVDPENGFVIIGEPKVLIMHNSDKYGWEAQWNRRYKPRRLNCPPKLDRLIISMNGRVSILYGTHSI